MAKGKRKFISIEKYAKLKKGQTIQTRFMGKATVLQPANENGEILVNLHRECWKKDSYTLIRQLISSN